jgi:hypothetical protein
MEGILGVLILKACDFVGFHHQFLNFVWSAHPEKW